MGKHKTPRIKVAIPEDVLRDLKDLADEAGVPVSSLAARIIRAWLKESGDRVARELWDRSRSAREAREAYLRLIGALNRIGGNLNQIARWVNVQREVDRAAWEEISRIREAMAHIARDWRPAVVLEAIRAEEEEGDADNA